MYVCVHQESVKHWIEDVKPENSVQWRTLYMTLLKKSRCTVTFKGMHCSVVEYKSLCLWCAMLNHARAVLSNSVVYGLPQNLLYLRIIGTSHIVDFMYIDLTYMCKNLFRSKMFCGALYSDQLLLCRTFTNLCMKGETCVLSLPQNWKPCKQHPAQIAGYMCTVSTFTPLTFSGNPTCEHTNHSRTNRSA